MSIYENIQIIKENIKCECVRSGIDPNTITIIAATKTVEPKRIAELKQAEITIAGENRVQEFLDKHGKVDTDWHFIGALQTNKVKYIIDKVSLIHSLDRFSLADEIDRQAKKHLLTANVLIEINMGAEESKSGVSPAELDEFLRYVSKKTNILIKGFMSVLPVNAQETLYKKLFDLYNKYKQEFNLSILSAGMTGDYQTAIRNGANTVRIGSAIFGTRT